MPPTSSASVKFKEEETAPTEEDADYHELFDDKDPRIVPKAYHDVREADSNREKDSLNAFANVQSSRHLLLKLKSVLPELENAQIPLVEDSVKKREDLFSIIQQ